ncbi:Serine/threonine-protein kinase HT1 [Hordeum vulgare]|nr:Serine/threonine-protein kinase HT1 [Hordeum vulgare]
MAGSGEALDPCGRERQPGEVALVDWARTVSRARGAVALAGAWRPCSAVGDGGYPAQLREKSLLRAGRLRQEVERLHLARSFGGAVKSCLADRCYTESCLVGRCYARQISRSLRIWTDERRAVAPLGVVVASADDWTGKDDADLFPEDGSVVRG